MNGPLIELEKTIIHQLQLVNSLKNEVEHKELEKDDQLRDVTLGIIDVLDSFERVEAGLVAKELDKNAVVATTIKRYQTVRKKLLHLLEQHGISRIDFPDNKLVVGFCEVLETGTDSSKENDEIISVVRNGYTRDNQLIRSAQIIIVKN